MQTCVLSWCSRNVEGRASGCCFCRRPVAMPATPPPRSFIPLLCATQIDHVLARLHHPLLRQLLLFEHPTPVEGACSEQQLQQQLQEQQAPSPCRSHGCAGDSTTSSAAGHITTCAAPAPVHLPQVLAEEPAPASLQLPAPVASPAGEAASDGGPHAMCGGVSIETDNAEAEDEDEADMLLVDTPRRLEDASGVFQDAVSPWMGGWYQPHSAGGGFV